MTKKGVTLIELIVVMSLLSILFMGGIKIYDFYKSTKSSIQTKESLYDIEESLSYGKLYCNNENLSGKIVLSKQKNGYSIVFYIYNGDVISTKTLYDICIYDSKFSVVLNQLIINLDNHGVIDPNTIRIKDKFGKKYEIAISVGSNKITMRNV